MPRLQSIDALTAEALYIFLPGYSAPRDGESFNDAGALLNRIANWLPRCRSRALGEHIRIHRDYYANPRTPAYMINAAGELISKSNVGRAVLVVGGDIDVQASDIPWIDELYSVSGALSRSTRTDLKVVPRPGDIALLLHSDALGLGLTGLEQKLLAAGFGQVAVLNGRRRCYRLDSSLRGLLGRHRFLSETRIVESILAALARCFGFVFSVIDRRSSKESR